MTKPEKKELVKSLKEKFKKAKAIIFTDFTGVTVPEIEDLRKQLREKNIDYQIIKKNLLKRVYPKINYQGPVACAIGNDEISLSKILYNFEKIKILGGKGLDLKMIETLAKLPSKEELFTKLVCLLKNNTNKLILCLKNIKA